MAVRVIDLRRLRARARARGAPSPVDERSGLEPLPRLPQGVTSGVRPVRGTRTTRKANEVKIPRAGVIRTSLRLLRWLRGFTSFLAGTLLARDSTEERALRLRDTFKGLGATFVKIGQQLSLRLDLLPSDYCEALQTLQDKAEALPLSVARAAIEAAAGGRRLEEVYSSIDEVPIGSASIACVYRATRADTGEVVAIKVRRPGIDKVFAADVRAIGWVGSLLELTLIAPGQLQHLLGEFRDMLFEELDLASEARYTELFRTQSKQLEQTRVTSPRVHFDLSNGSVMVTEYVEGVWVNQLLDALDAEDEEKLSAWASLGIHPEDVARTLLRNVWEQAFEGWFFHADLHSANILVQPGGQLVLIDFGSCGAYTPRDRRVWRRIFQTQERGDISGMAQACLALLEPLPPIETNELTRRMEALLWQDYYAHKSEHPLWWERTSAGMWYGFIKLAREYDIPMNLNTLRMFRGTMLSDTLAAQLHPTINHYDELRAYQKIANRRTRKRVRKKLRSVARDEIWLRLDGVLEGADSAVFTIQRTFDHAESIFSRLIPSWMSLVGELFVLALRVAGLTGATAGVIYLFYLARDLLLGTESAGALEHPSFLAIVLALLRDSRFEAVMCVLVVVSLRRIHYAMKRREGTE